MIDKALYIGMNGAQLSANKLAILTNNLANLNTTGFRGDFTVSTPFEVANTPSRTYSTLDRTYSDLKEGPIMETGRTLDIAISGPGFISVQNKQGEEGLTRAGSLQITQDGILTTETGDLVLSEGGLITLPPSDRIEISQNGMVMAHPSGAAGTDLIEVARIKLVNPSADMISKGEDGLFYLGEGQAAAVDDNVKLVSSALEGSNVSPVVALTQMIELSRDYERQMNVVRTVADNTRAANRLLDMS